MYYYIAIFSQFVATPTACIINVMDLKIFPNTTMLLKIDHFKGFSNWNNIDEMVINSTTVNLKLNNNLTIT